MRGMVSASHLRARSANAATDSVARADAVSVMTAACVNAYDVSGESYWPETVMTLPFGRSQCPARSTEHGANRFEAAATTQVALPATRCGFESGAIQPNKLLRSNPDFAEVIMCRP